MQDTWYVNSNLTLTFGVRGDKPARPTDHAPGVQRHRSPSGRGLRLRQHADLGWRLPVQPRFGFNYTFDTERQMQLRGGVGLFQGDAPQVWVGNAYNNTGLNYIAYSTYDLQYTGLRASRGSIA